MQLSEEFCDVCNSNSVLGDGKSSGEKLPDRLDSSNSESSRRKNDLGRLPVSILLGLLKML